jgi:arsenical pump membrane protein
VRDVVLLAVFVATIVALYIRPKRIQDWHVAGAGGLIAWVLGPLWFEDGAEILRDSLNILAFFLGLMLVAAAADTAGLYASAARVLGRRSGTGMVVAVLALGSLVTAILSNDATPLVLTPAVLAVAAARGTAERGSLLGVTFVADGASLLLPISNPVNLLFYDRLDIGFGTWSAEILPAAAAGVFAMCAVHVLRGRRRVPTAGEPVPAAPIESPRERAAWYRRYVLIGVVVLAVVYVAASIEEWPLGWVSLGAGVALALPASAAAAPPREIARHVSPGLFVFVAGLVLLVDSAQAAGLFGPVADALDWLAGQPALVTVAGAAALGALLSNLMNNWPAALLVSAAIGASADPSGQLIAGALVGCTIGASFTVVGSLSTFFWLTLIRARGVTFSPAAYAREAAWPTAAGMVAAVAVAALFTA